MDSSSTSSLKSTSQSAAAEAVNEQKLAIFKAIEKNVEIQQSSGRQERVFGVVTIGNSKNVISTRVSVSDRGERSYSSSGGSFDETSQLELSPAPTSNCTGKGISSPLSTRYARFESCPVSPNRSNVFVQKLSESKHSVRTSASSTVGERTEFTSSTPKSADDPSSSKTKSTRYGVVWKTPGVVKNNSHRRSKSTDFSLLAGVESTTPTRPSPTTRLESMSSNSLIDDSDAGHLSPADSRKMISGGNDIENTSVLKYFQVGEFNNHTKSGTGTGSFKSKLESPQPEAGDKSSSSAASKRTSNYEMLWLSGADDQNKSSVKQDDRAMNKNTSLPLHQKSPGTVEESSAPTE